MRRSNLRLLTGALALSTAALLSACSGDDGRPSADELSDVISDQALAGGASQEVVDCMAELFHDSDLSDGFLRALVEEQDDYEPSDADTEAMADLTTSAATECTGAGSDD